MAREVMKKKKTTANPQMSSAPSYLRDVSAVFAASASHAVPVSLVALDTISQLELSTAQAEWVTRARFNGQARRHVVIPGSDGRAARVLAGAGDGRSGDPCGPSELLLGHLPRALPDGSYCLGDGIANQDLAALAWGLGAYRFQKSSASNLTASNGGLQVSLALPTGVNAQRIKAILEAVWLARDLINAPASHLSPADLEMAVREVGARHDAHVTSVVGEDLLAHNFPMIHAVGRASPRAPRLIDLTWEKPGGRKDAPRITLVGKGITFDTGGLDLKPASAMLLMKKDMGGAAVVLALAHMIMAQGLDVRLRLLIASAENSVSGDAFRPGDVLISRAGLTVEIGNTDAEGRLVLADALALADEDSPDSIFVFATLTGAARTALGPDLPALFTDDDDLAARLVQTGFAIGDPVWRLPLWDGYAKHLESDTADLNNVWESPFAGAITAALFLRRFVTKARRFAHFDLYGWRASERALGPKGGEAQTARTVFEVLSREAQR